MPAPRGRAQGPVGWEGLAGSACGTAWWHVCPHVCARPQPARVSRCPAAAPITFQAHLGDHPDLPRWLRYVQRDPHQPGYLYGCPTAAEVGTHVIEVGATRMDPRPR